MAYMTQFYSWATGNTITAARLNGNITNIINSLNASGGDKQVNVGSLEVGGVQVIDSSMNLDLGSSNLTLGGLLSIDADGTALNASGSLTMGTGNDAGMFFDGTDMVIITDGAGASGIILDSEDDTIEIKGSGVLQATFDTGGLNVVSGDAYSIAGTSVLNATTLGTGVLTSSLTTVGILNSGSITSGFGSIDVGSSNIDGGTITAATALGGTLSTAAQPNITSIGTLTALTITGDLTVDTSTLFVDSTNNRVGIGTATPSSALEVNGQMLISQGSSSAPSYSFSGVTDMGFYRKSTTQMAYADNGEDKVVFASVGGSSQNFQMIIDDTNSVGIPGYSFINDTNTGMFGGFTSAPDVLGFSTGGSERMRIDASGNLGIGVTTVSAKLHVSGDTIITGDLTVDTNTLFVDSSANRIGIGTASPLSTCHISKGSSGASSFNTAGDILVLDDNVSNGMTISTPSTGIGSIFFADESDTFIGGFRYDHTDDSLGVYANNSEIVSIISTQRVGIRTTAPTATLHVDQVSGSGAIPVIKMDQGDASEPFIDFIGTAAANATSSISTLNTSGATTDHIQIDLNGVKAWIAVSTNDPS